MLRFLQYFNLSQFNFNFVKWILHDFFYEKIKIVILRINLNYMNWHKLGGHLSSESSRTQNMTRVQTLVGSMGRCSLNWSSFKLLNYALVCAINGRIIQHTLSSQLLYSTSKPTTLQLLIYSINIYTYSWKQLWKRDLCPNTSMSVSFEHKSSKSFLENFIA